jgi:hypothetical protein
MRSHSDNKPVRIFWDHLRDPDSAKLVRQAVELILAEIERDSTVADFDKIVTHGHAEGVPVESNEKSIFTES